MGARLHGSGARGGVAAGMAAMALAMLLTGCAPSGTRTGGGTGSTTAPTATSPPAPPATTPVPTTTTRAPTGSSLPGTPVVSGSQEPTVHATLVFGGDLLMHVPLGASVLDPTTGHYDFSSIFAPISPYLDEGDLAAADLETVLAGAGRGYSGYPRMNSPTDLAAELAESGFDLIATATNHSLDQGWDGLVATVDALDVARLAHTGSYRSADERGAPLVRDVRGIKVAFLAYAEWLNGLPLPIGHRYAVSMLERGQVSDDVRRARDAGAELVVAQVHWGSEYQRQPSRPQREAARMLLEEGVDVIVGSHPHVVQPIATMTVDRAGRPFTGFVAYSLGNLVSTQVWRYSDSGLLLYVDIEKAVGASKVAGAHVAPAKGAPATRVTGLRYLPVYVQRGWEAGRRAYRVVPVGPDIAPTWSPAPTEADRRRMAQVGEELGVLLSGQVGVTAR